MSSVQSQSVTTTDESYPRRWWALIALSLALFMASLDNTILTIALPTLARELGASTDLLQWTVDSYLVTFAGLLLVAGALVDGWGMRRTFLVGTIAFTVFSLAAGLSPNVHILIVARALMGLGAALLTPSTLAFVSMLFTDAKERSVAFAVWSGANAAGSAVGPLLAGILLEHFSWGSVFLINVPIGLLVLPIALFVLPKVAAQRGSGSIDYVGALLSTLSLALICWTFISAPGLSLTHPLILLGAAAGVVLLVAFIAWERKFSNPILDVDLFKIRRFAVAVAVAGLVTGAGGGALFVLPQYLQFSLDYGPLASGIRILPVAAMLGVGAVLAPAMIKRLKIKRTVLIGLSSVVIGLVWVGMAQVGTTYAMVLPGAMFFGFGSGLLIPAATQAVMDALPKASSGVGSATNSAMMQMGSALGVAIAGALLAARYRRAIMSADCYAELGQWQNKAVDSIAGAIEAAERVGGELAQRLLDVAHYGFIDGMRWALLGGAFSVLLAGITVAFCYPDDKHEELNKETAPADLVVD